LGTVGQLERVAYGVTPKQGITGKALGAFLGWPAVRQFTSGDPTGRGAATQSARSAHLPARTTDADHVVKSICPYCAVGCGQKVFVSDGKVTQIEGDPDSPISRGRLCPKGSASHQLVTTPSRITKVRYRKPHSTEWEDLDLDVAMEMIADRVMKTRNDTWQEFYEGHRVRRTMGIASLGGATLDNEENYLMKKLYTALGAVQIENQARI
jgi:formate dehydrogenase major subunit